MPAKFGSHMSMAGGHDRAVRAAHAVGFSTVQVFTKSNNQWRAAAADRRPRLGLPRGPGRDRGGRAGGPRLVPDQPGQPRRRPLGEVDRLAGRRDRAGRGPGDRRPGDPPGRPRRLGRGGRPGPDRPGARRGPPPDPRASRSGSPWRRPPARGSAWATASSTSAGSSTWSASPSGWASASTPAIFSPRGIPWGRPRSTMTRLGRWSGPSGRAGSGSCT